MATEVDRVELGYNRSAHRALVVLPGGASVLMVVTHLHHLGPDEGIRDEQTAAILAWLARCAVDRCDRPRRRLQRRPGGADPRPAARRGVPLRLRGGERRGAGGHLAVGADRAGDGHRRRPRVPRLHLGPRRGPASSRRGSPSTARIPRTPTLYPSDHLGIAAQLEIG